MWKRFLAACLAMILAAALAACGKDKKADLGSDLPSGGGQNSAAGCNGDVHIIENKNSVSLGTPEQKLDPQQVYAGLTYVPEMFYGSYRALGTREEAGKQAFGRDHATFELEEDGRTVRYTLLPYQFRAGPESIRHVIYSIGDKDWMELYFMKDTGSGQFYLDTMYCAYTIEGSKLLCNPISSWELDENNKVSSYEMTDLVLEYEFSFRGRELTLRSGGESVTLVCGMQVYTDDPLISAEGYLDLTTRGLDGITFIDFYHDHDSEYPDHINFSDAKFDSRSGGVVCMEENGLLTFTVPWEEGTKTYQAVYFYCDEDGLVLADGEEVYYYTKGYTARQKQLLQDSVPQEEAEVLETMTETQLEQIVEKKDNLLEDLVKAFEDAGIAVTVNPATGEIAMDASVLWR